MNSNSGLYKFHGGIHLEGHKEVSSESPISQLDIPNKLVLAIKQHMGIPAQPVVNIGDKVLKGQLIAISKGEVSAAIHAPSSGTVTAIEDSIIAHPSGLKGTCIEIKTDGEDRWTKLNPVGMNYRQAPVDQLLERMKGSGIVGLGGAAFPASSKLEGSRKGGIRTLIINAVECEPWISCDQILIQERVELIFSGINVLMHLTQAQNCIIGIEDNMPDSIAALRRGIPASSTKISIKVVPTIYPTGGEKQLIKVLTNREVPAKGIPLDIGFIVFNVATACAIHDFIVLGKPLVSRIVTVTGDGVANPQNIEAPIGANIRDLVEHAGGYTREAKRITMGGPMMGICLRNDSLPLVKASNCILVQTSSSITPKPEQLPCIRCGACAEVCPANLLPQQLYWYARAKNLDTLKKFSIDSCIECGCCDYVCPSHIPLVHYFRYGKSEIKSAQTELLKSDNARLRHEARTIRLERIKEEKAKKLAEKKAVIAARNKKQNNKQKSAIRDALNRAKERKQARESEANEKGENNEN